MATTTISSVMENPPCRIMRRNVPECDGRHAVLSHIEASIRRTDDSALRTVVTRSFGRGTGLSSGGMLRPIGRSFSDPGDCRGVGE